MMLYRPEDFGFGRLFWKSPEAILVIDWVTRHVVLWNHMAETIFDRIRQQERQVPLTTLFANDGNLECLTEPLVPGRIYRSEQSLPSPPGAQVEFLCSLIEEATVPGTFMLAYVRDITEKKATERQLKARAAELEQANLRLQELDRLKGNFINVASHELRTPLTSIAGYAEFLEDSLAGPLNLTQQEYVQQIQEGAKRLSVLIDDLLDFARLEAGSFHLSIQESDLTALILEEAVSLRPQLQAARHHLSFSLPSDPMLVRMDAKRIGQVLLNLIGNAIKFTPPGGRLEVGVEKLAASYRIEVKDSGIGIAREHVSRLFDKFFQVDPSMTRTYGGAGLGLAISRSLVEAHGGAIGVESTLGEGTTFWFSLPRQPNPALTMQLFLD